MELGLNVGRADDRPPNPGADAHVAGPLPSIFDELGGEIAAGPLMLQLNEPAGIVLREARRTERAHFRPRPLPIMLRPRALRSLMDRRTETEAALSAIDAGIPVELSGAPGAGKTALLRHLAHHPRAGSFAGGVVYVSARHHTSVDLLQRIFEAFYESDTICRPTHAQIRSALQDTHALILIDDAGLPQNELEPVLEIAPRSAFVVATRERRLWGEVRSIALTGLAAEDGALLLQRELELSFDAEELSAAAELCAAMNGNPRRIQQAAALIRERGLRFGEWSSYSTTEGLLAELMTSIGEKERRALMALSAMSGVGIESRHVSGIAELPDVEPSLMALVGRGLVIGNRSRYRLADGVADRLRRTGDPAPWINRAVTYFTAWAERQRRDRDSLLDAADALLRVQQHAIETQRRGEALRLGRLLEGALVTSARWGDWGLALEGCLCAAKATGDRTVEAWALHQMGTRAVCLGEAGNARRLLTQSAVLRETLGEHAAAAISRRNLGFVAAAIADDSDERPAPAVGKAPALESLPFRSATEAAVPAPATTRTGVSMLIVFLTCVILGGMTYAGISRFPWNVWRAPARDQAPPPVAQTQAARGASDPLPLREMTEVVTRPDQAPPSNQRANILIFTARPGSIVTSKATSLCYAVSDAARARIEPGVGEVDPAATLTCRRVAPARTTTYELTATGRDGVPVVQRVVIIVR